MKLFSNFRQETEKKMSGDVISRARKLHSRTLTQETGVMFLTYIMYIM